MKNIKYMLMIAALLIAGQTACAVVISSVSDTATSPNNAVLGGILHDFSLNLVDRTHAYTAIPAFLLDKAEYIKTANASRDVSNYKMTITLTSNADVYLFIDKRVDMNTKMAWVAQMGFVKMENPAVDIGIDENYWKVPSEPGINNWSWVYKGSFSAGTIELKEQYNGSLNMYGVAAIAGIPAAGNPDPSDGQENVALNKVMTWTASTSPNIDPNVAVQYRVYMDPNETKVSDGSGCAYFQNFSTSTSFDPISDLTLSIQYYWRVDVKCQLKGKTEPNTFPGEIWDFKAIGPAPVVTAGSNVLTSFDLMPATLSGTVSDLDGDTSTITWTILTDDSAYPGVPSNGGMRALNRNAYTADPTYTNLLQDWIAADAREKGCDYLKLTINNLPAGTYSWKSYHHDTQDQTGIFDLTIVDADGTHAPIMGDISNGAAQPFDPNVTKIATTVRSDGTNPITLTFDMRYTAGQADSLAFAVVNGFDLVSDTADPDLYVDFGQAASPVQSGYSAYGAGDKVLADFGAKTYSAFGAATITVNADFGRVVNASVTNTTTNWQTPTASFTTDVVGTYKVRLTATDNDGSNSKNIEVRAFADACAAAKNNPNGAYAALTYDFNSDCAEDIKDLIQMAAKWLEDKSLTGQVSFTGAATYDQVVQP